MFVEKKKRSGRSGRSRAKKKNPSVGSTSSGRVHVGRFHLLNTQRWKMADGMNDLPSLSRVCAHREKHKIVFQWPISMAKTEPESVAGSVTDQLHGLLTAISRLWGRCWMLFRPPPHGRSRQKDGRSIGRLYKENGSSRNRRQPLSGFFLV